ncbi:hypothetical protein ISF_05709 [Cordyceps fumosorosea ARSEF 2679]|uniref:Nuclear distribution protein n=1 Tax=Cordyceps fumosorosea (strain ARSEF 2679) TaxID=1081104 RepID=A0A167TJR1_CORFA|nr:hypothetical protein ISF_05709 [Cordyceps fumosorosea ARSEF 2679]OAA60670.1 hypothetical protein ISF_05709 [Cordyceps fumosorosea ARSEF 2679]
MESPLDQTTLSTISLLESRLLRVEHLLYGSSTPPTQHDSALRQLTHLEKRFSTLTSRIRVYGDLLKICTSFANPPSLAPTLPPAEAEAAELRGRSEAALRAWYEAGLLPASEATARIEARVGGVERRVRRKERERELEKEL